jgi:hypothetical protein
MDEFYKTGMGKKFFDHNVPRIQNALERIATNLENNTQLNREILEAINTLVFIAEIHIDDALINQTDSEFTIENWQASVSTVKDFLVKQLKRK